MSLWPLMMACLPEDDTSEGNDPDVGTEVSDPVPYEPDIEAPSEAPSADGLATIIETSITEALRFNSSLVFDAYDLMMDKGTETCPEVYDKDGYSLWFNGCSTDDATFSGYAYDLYADDVYDGYTTYSNRTISGAMGIYGVDGSVFLGEGNAVWLEGFDDGKHGAIYTQSQIVGAFEYSEAETGTYLANGESSGIGFYAISYPSFGANAMFIYGGIAFKVDSDTVAVNYDEQGTIMAKDLGVDCEAEPGGIVQVRDANGLWYDVHFDGPIITDAEEYYGNPDCDGCGEVYFRGDHIGQTCPDFSAWLDWEERPW